VEKLGHCNKHGTHNKGNFLAAKFLELLHTCENHDFIKALISNQVLGLNNN